jgi:O-acetyl-ADP-ribose deacetylase (regulator of RNase III)
MTGNRREPIASRLEAIEGDITTLALDAIVNAANEPLIRGGGVDGAIRHKAGPGIEVELRKIGRCPTGTAIITDGHLLPAKFVIHTVAPVWSDAKLDGDADRLLRGCYLNALRLADAHDIATIAFPCIGTGIYGWPAERAARIAFDAVNAHLAAGGKQARVLFCCFSREDRARYAAMISTG